ncbi:MAG: hypothetical protein LUD29_01335 [Clostridia bacterium]|nr:hypothetical protein [Clostridia bacterium]
MRTQEVSSKQEMNNLVNNLVVQGYQTESITDSSAHLIKMKKMSIAGLIILLLLGIIFGIIYLAVCLTRAPQDEVLITVRQNVYQQQPQYGYNPQQGYGSPQQSYGYPPQQQVNPYPNPNGQKGSSENK